MKTRSCGRTVLATGNDRVDRMAFPVATITNGWLASRKLRSAGELELGVPPAGIKSGASHRPSPGGERRRKRKRSRVLLERTREGHRQSDRHRNYSKGNTRDGVERIMYWAIQARLLTPLSIA